MHDATDLAVIQRHINRLGVAALAEQIRAQDVALVRMEDATPARAVAYQALDPAPRRVAHRESTVRPAPAGSDVPCSSRWSPTGSQWALLGFIAVTTGLAIWAVIWIVESIASAVDVGVHAVAAAAPGLLGLVALVLLVSLLCKPGGGSRISGTFEGRIHHD